MIACGIGPQQQVCTLSEVRFCQAEWLHEMSEALVEGVENREMTW